MKKKAKRARKARRFKSGIPVFLPDRDYRVTFRNGCSSIYHGHAIDKNPSFSFDEVARVDEVGGKLVYLAGTR